MRIGCSGSGATIAGQRAPRSHCPTTASSSALAQAVGLGWLSRARALLEPLDEAAEHGWCEIRAAELALSVQHDPVRALAAADRAAQIAVRVGQPDLGVVALALEGLSLTQAGDIETGMPRLDAAVAAATTGEVPDVMWMGKVCCWLIAACDETQDVTRAAEWCRRVESVCADQRPRPPVQRLPYPVRVGAGGPRYLGRSGAGTDRGTGPTLRVAAELSRRSGGAAGRTPTTTGPHRRGRRPVRPGGIPSHRCRRPRADPARERRRGSRVDLDQRAAAHTSRPEPAGAGAVPPARRTSGDGVGDEDAAGIAADEPDVPRTATGTDALIGLSAIADAALAGPKTRFPSSARRCAGSATRVCGTIRLRLG